MLLGEFDFSTYQNQIKNKPVEYLRDVVSEIDIHVADVIQQVVSCNKIPIIIGGGHNNSYGNIKGTALAKGKPVNAINFDAHSDFRILEGRHSGNGFSYAYEEAFLKKYFIFLSKFIRSPVLFASS